MAGSFLDADVQMLNLSGKKSVDEKLDEIQNYLFLLLENLRYTLRNLGADNFNTAELQQILQEAQGGTDVGSSEEIYGNFGAIADLLVYRLRTDYRRALRYLNGDTSELDYIEIQGGQINLVSAVTNGTSAQQMTIFGRSFYWTDATRSQMTCTQVTDWPVMAYTYTETVKASLAFATDSSQNTIPTLVFSAGTATQGNGYLQKGDDSFNLWLVNSSGALRGLFIGDSYVDIKGLRRTVSVDFSHLSDGYWEEMVEGDSTVYRHSFSQSSNSFTETSPDGVQTVVTF